MRDNIFVESWCRISKFHNAMVFRDDYLGVFDDKSSEFHGGDLAFKRFLGQTRKPYTLVVARDIYNCNGYSRNPFKAAKADYIFHPHLKS